MKFSLRRTGLLRRDWNWAALGVALTGVGLTAPTAWAQGGNRPHSNSNLAIPAPVRSPPNELGIIEPVKDTRIVAVDAVKSARTVVADQIRHGLLTPQAAFESKQLTVDDILQILASGQRLSPGERNEELES